MLFSPREGLFATLISLCGGGGGGWACPGSSTKISAAAHGSRLWEMGVFFINDTFICKGVQ